MSIRNRIKQIFSFRNMRRISDPTDPKQLDLENDLIVIGRLGTTASDRSLLNDDQFVITVGQLKEALELSPATIVNTDNYVNTGVLQGSTLILNRIGTDFLPPIAIDMSAIGGIGGGGTTNRIPIWTSADTLGNSEIFQTSTGDITVETTLTVKNDFTTEGDSSFLGDVTMSNQGNNGDIIAGFNNLGTIQSYKLGSALVLNGDILDVDLPTDIVTGTGTPSIIPMWDAAGTALVDSLFKQDNVQHASVGDAFTINSRAGANALEIKHTLGEVPGIQFINKGDSTLADIKMLAAPRTLVIQVSAGVIRLENDTTVDGQFTVTGLSGTTNTLIQTNTGGVLQRIKIGSGLKLSGGELTATGGGGSGLTGSGTLNTLPVWTAASDLADSIVDQRTSPIRQLRIDGSLRINIEANSSEAGLIIVDTTEAGILAGPVVVFRDNLNAFLGSVGPSEGTSSDMIVRAQGSNAVRIQSTLLKTDDAVTVGGNLTITGAAGTGTELASLSPVGLVSRLELGTGLSIVGNELVVALPAGTLTGSGTINTLPVWDGTTDLGDSSISQNATGSNVTISAATVIDATTTQEPLIVKSSKGQVAIKLEAGGNIVKLELNSLGEFTIDQNIRYFTQATPGENRLLGIDPSGLVKNIQVGTGLSLSTNGVLTATGGSTGTIGGTGTAGFLPVWASSTSLGDSIIQQLTPTVVDVKGVLRVDDTINAFSDVNISADNRLGFRSGGRINMVYNAADTALTANISTEKFRVRSNLSTLLEVDSATQAVTVYNKAIFAALTGTGEGIAGLKSNGELNRLIIGAGLTLTGNVLTAGTTGIGGSGTVNFIPKFGPSSTDITDSIIREFSGNTIQINGDLNVGSSTTPQSLLVYGTSTFSDDVAIRAALVIGTTGSGQDQLTIDKATNNVFTFTTKGGTISINPTTSFTGRADFDNDLYINAPSNLGAVKLLGLDNAGLVNELKLGQGLEISGSNQLSVKGSGLTGTGVTNKVALWTDQTSLTFSIISQTPNVSLVTINGTLSIDTGLTLKYFNNTPTLVYADAKDAIKPLDISSDFTLSGGVLSLTNSGGGGTVDGNGTAGQLAVWADSDTLADSIVSEAVSGGSAILTVDGKIEATGNVESDGSVIAAGNVVSGAGFFDLGDINQTNGTRQIRIIGPQTDLDLTIQPKGTGKTIFQGGTIWIEALADTNADDEELAGLNKSGIVGRVGIGTGLQLTGGVLSTLTNGNISGTGSSPQVPVWTGGSTLGDSIIAATATSVTVAGTLTVDTLTNSQDQTFLVGANTASGTLRQVSLDSGTLALNNGVLSVVGGGGGGVTGSGTIDKLPRWSGATALADSLFYQTGGQTTAGVTFADGPANSFIVKNGLLSVARDDAARDINLNLTASPDTWSIRNAAATDNGNFRILHNNVPRLVMDSTKDTVGIVSRTRYTRFEYYETTPIGPFVLNGPKATTEWDSDNKRFSIRVGTTRMLNVNSSGVVVEGIFSAEVQGTTRFSISNAGISVNGTALIGGLTTISTVGGSGNVMVGADGNGALKKITIGNGLTLINDILSLQNLGNLIGETRLLNTNAGTNAIRTAGFSVSNAGYYVISGVVWVKNDAHSNLDLMISRTTDFNIIGNTNVLPTFVQVPTPDNARSGTRVPVPIKVTAYLEAGLTYYFYVVGTATAVPLVATSAQFQPVPLINTCKSYINIDGTIQ